MVHIKKVTFVKGGDNFAQSYKNQDTWYWIKDEAGDSLYVACAEKVSGSKEDSWIGKQIPNKPQDITGIWDYGKGSNTNDTCWRLILRYADFMRDAVTNLPPLSNPTLNVTDGTIYENSVNVTITYAAGASVYYTLDGSVPTATSTKYTGAIPISQTTTIKAIAMQEGHQNSDMVTAKVWIRQPDPETAGLNIYFEENFEKVKALSAVTTINGQLDKYMSMPGWTMRSGSQINTNPGKGLNMRGSLTSPELDLSQSEGTFYVAFKVANYRGLNSVDVKVGDQTQNFAVRHAASTAGDNFDYVVAKFTNGSAQAKITFENTGRLSSSTNNEVLLDSIRVYQAREPEIHVLTKVINLPAIATDSVTDTIRLSGRFLEKQVFIMNMSDEPQKDGFYPFKTVGLSPNKLNNATLGVPVKYKVINGPRKDTLRLQVRYGTPYTEIDTVYVYAETKACPKPTVQETGKTATSIDITVSAGDGVHVFEVRQSVGSGDFGAWQTLALDNGSAMLTGFEAGKYYIYQVRSVCATNYRSEVEPLSGTMPAADAPTVTLVSPSANSSFSDSVPVRFAIQNMVMGASTEHPDTTQGRAYVEFSEVGGERVYKDSICHDTIGKVLLPSGKYAFKLEMKNIKTGATIATIGGSNHYVTVALPKAAAPVFDSATNKVYYDELLMALHGAAGDIIHYSLDTGKTFHVYSAPVKITGYRQHLVKAFVSNPRFENSDTVSAVYTIRETMITVAEPVFSVADSSTITRATLLSLTCATEGAKIYYAFGKNVTPNTLYTAPFKLEGDTVHITARAEVVGQTATYRSSLVSAVYYLVDADTVDAPAFVGWHSEAYADSALVKLHCDTAGASIYYRLNDTGSFTLYVDSFYVRDTVTVYAYGYKAGLEYSDTVSKTYCVSKTPQVVDTFYTITVKVNDTTMGVVTGGGRFKKDTTVVLTATAKTGYEFVKWNDEVATATRNVKVVSDSTFTAVFKVKTVTPADTFYTITVKANDTAMGVVTGGGRFKKDTTVVLSATAKTGYEFVKWNDEVTTATRNVKVVSDSTFTAVFKVKEAPQPVDTFYTITVKANDSTYGTVTGSGRFKKDTTVTIKAVAKAGYKFVKWAEDNVTEAERSVKVVADATYTAVFEVSVDVEAAKSVDFTVYPNPNAGRFTVDVAEDALMEIYNAAGVCVQRARVTAGKRPVELHTAGLYFVKMTAHNRTTVKRIIVR